MTTAENTADQAARPATPADQAARPERTDADALDSILDESMAKNAAMFRYALDFGQAAAASEYFSDARSVSQSTIKIMAGHELGLPPVVSLMHVHVIKGKVGLDGNLVASLLRKAGYTWKVLQQDENGCELLFLKNGQIMTSARRNQDGSFSDVPLTISFTRKHAEDADLAGPRGKEKEKGMYEKYPRNMYFNRCITNFQRWHAPEVSNGITVYAVEELEDAVPAAPEPPMPRRKTTEAEAAQ